MGLLLMWQKQMEWRNSRPTPAAIQGLILLPPSLQFAQAWKRSRQKETCDGIHTAIHCYSRVDIIYFLPSLLAWWKNSFAHKERNTMSETQRARHTEWDRSSETQRMRHNERDTKGETQRARRKGWDTKARHKELDSKNETPKARLNETQSARHKERDKKRETQRARHKNAVSGE